jgi:magnesium-transporting ATPase (P-type)
MTRSGPTPEQDRSKQALMMALLGVIGQVGCLTLVIILVALFAGLWLDNQFHTRPLFALILVLASVPVTLFLMFRIVLSFGPRIQELSRQTIQSSREENLEDGELPRDEE